MHLKLLNELEDLVLTLNKALGKLKKGSQHNTGNYRPIHLTSIVCKLTETFIKESIIADMRSESALPHVIINMGLSIDVPLQCNYYIFS